jgi:hypothetical protein
MGARRCRSLHPVPFVSHFERLLARLLFGGGGNPGGLVRQLYDGYGEEVVIVGGGAYGSSGFIWDVALLFVVRGLEPDRVGAGGKPSTTVFVPT